MRTLLYYIVSAAETFWTGDILSPIIFRKTELFITFDIDNYYSVVDGLTIKTYYLEQKYSHVKEIEWPESL